jgi:hypothetical protein
MFGGYRLEKQRGSSPVQLRRGYLTVLVASSGDNHDSMTLSVGVRNSPTPDGNVTLDGMATLRDSKGALGSAAIVVVNYGSHELLASNLAAVSRATPESLYVVVDNFTSAAEQQEVGRLGAEHGWTILFLATNTGFGHAVNAGVEAAISAGCKTSLFSIPTLRSVAQASNA